MNNERILHCLSKVLNKPIESLQSLSPEQELS